MATAQTEPYHLKREKLADRAKTVVLEIAEKLRDWKSNDQDMQHMSPKDSLAFKPYVEEFMHYSNVFCQPKSDANLTPN